MNFEVSSFFFMIVQVLSIYLHFLDLSDWFHFCKNALIGLEAMQMLIISGRHTFFGVFLKIFSYLSICLWVGNWSRRYFVDPGN